ncbi:primosomal protein N', partial [Candidatus Fermentibacterales bacterium]|nr:primosomal protein N' [Candidatus Fermentibacterales bacterium]
LWHAFTYSLPDSLDGGDLPGCRVLVPFGSDRLVGFVWDHEGPFRSEPAPRAVIDRLDSVSPLPARVLELVRWSARYYHAPPGMMAAAALPPGTSGRAIRRVRLLGEPPATPLTELLRRRVGSVSELRKRLGSGYRVDEELSRLEYDRLAETWWEPASSSRPVRERLLLVSGNRDRLLETADRLRSRAPRQAEVLAAVASAEGPVRRSEIVAATGASSSSIAALIARGLLSEELRDIPVELTSPASESLLAGADRPELSPAQASALDRILSAGQQEGATRTLLLHGATGSGKTEVYMRAIESVLEAGRSALVLVPEISLTPQAVARFRTRFPGELAVLHSGLSPGERLSSWNSVSRGERRIVIGARSAIFSPSRDTGLIIVDEEHDGSYKQAETPRYNARDLACVRGRLEGATVVLGSATPSFESYGNAMLGRYELIELPDRIDARPMPRVTLVGPGETPHPLLSDALLAGIGKSSSRGEQAIVLINRRGFAPSRVCRNCGHSEECPRCGISLTYHRKRVETLRCHHCDYWTPAAKRCPRCGCDSFSHLGPGIQKVEKALQELLPATRVLRMDSDTTRSRRSHWEILEAFARGEGDVLLGTQMVAKGHDFPNVTLVGVIAADMGLTFPDFRAAERTFQLVVQVAGRAGRGDVPGQVVVQAFDPTSPILRAAAAHDYGTFWEMESPLRERFGYPPFTHLIRYVWSGTNESRVADAAMATVKATGASESGEPSVLGPVPAVLSRINRRYRWTSIARSSSRRALSSYTDDLIARFDDEAEAGVRLDVDVDPYDML